MIGLRAMLTASYLDAFPPGPPCSDPSLMLLPDDPLKCNSSVAIPCSNPPGAYITFQSKYKIVSEI